MKIVNKTVGKTTTSVTGKGAMSNAQVEIYKYLEERIIDEIDAMPYNLTKGQINKLLIKSLTKVGFEVANMFGVENPNLQGIIDIFFLTNGFPDFPNECYLEILNGTTFKINRLVFCNSSSIN